MRLAGAPFESSWAGSQPLRWPRSTAAGVDSESEPLSAAPDLVRRRRGGGPGGCMIYCLLKFNSRHGPGRRGRAGSGSESEPVSARAAKADSTQLRLARRSQCRTGPRPRSVRLGVQVSSATRAAAQPAQGSDGHHDSESVMIES